MAFMLVRVELHENSSYDKPTAETYTKLHSQVLAAGFSRQVKIVRGASTPGLYWLPPATYATADFATANAALVKAWDAAKGLGYRYAVATAGSDFDAYGLTPVTP